MGRAVVVLLGLTAAVLALSPRLPALQPIALDVVVACVVAASLLGACAVAVAELEETIALLALGMLAAAILAVGLQVGGLERVASLPKVALAAGAGVVFARTFDQGAFVLAVPLLVGGLDLVFTLGGGSATVAWPALITTPDPLLVVLPSWGGQLFVGAIGLSTFAFLGALQAWAVARDLRPRATGPAMVVAVVLGLVLEAQLGREIPKTALLVVGFLAVAGDRLPGLARGTGSAPR